MKFPFAGLALLSAILLGSPAAAEVTGSWRITGDLSGHAFALDCRFAPQGAKLGGVCVEAASGDPKVHAGTAHPLTRGAVNGNQASWAYQSSFLLSKFDVSFTGVVDGGRISGTVSAAGRKGEFAGARK